MLARIFFVAILMMVLTKAYSENLPVAITKKGGGQVLIYNQSTALLIYASKYKDKFWPELKNVPSDIQNVRQALEQQGFTVEVEPDVTSEKIIPRIQSFLGQRFSPNSRAVVYYSGHGFTEPSGEAYLVGTDLPHPGDSKEFNGGLVSIRALRAVITASKANHTLLVLDSCYSGAVLETKSSLPPPSTLLVDKIKQRAVWLLASGSAKQRVSADQVFAQVFVNGLRGDAAKDPQRRYLTISELAWWVEQTVPNYSNQTPVSGPISAAGGDILFVPRVDNVVASAQIVPNAAFVAGSAKIASESKKEFAGRFPNVQVYYYRKAGDDLNVIKALSSAHIPYTAMPPQLPDRLKTNSVFCGPSTPIEAVKEVAYALMDKGIEIELIHEFYKNKANKKNRIEIVSTVDAVTLKPINGKKFTRSDVDALSSCPKSPSN